MRRFTLLFAAAIAALALSCTEEPVEVSSVSLDKTAVELFIGGSEKLNATVAPDNAADKTVSWSSSDQNTVSVDRAGAIKALAVGSATITAKAGSKSASCKVTVMPIVVESVKLDRTELKLFKGETAKLTATVRPSDATEAAVTWSSSDDKVAAVDQDGNVTAAGLGKAQVIASAGSCSAICSITVEAASITAIAIDPQTVSIVEGKTQQLSVRYIPVDSEGDKELDWVSADKSIAEVDQNGLVTGMRPGTVEIHARLRSNHYIQSYSTVTVTRDETLRGIAVNPKTVDLKLGRTRQLELVFTPDYAANKSVSWTSSDSSIADVSSTGLVTALGVGQAVITATSEEGGHTAVCEVNVGEAVPDIYCTSRDGRLYLDGSELVKDYSAGLVLSDGSDIYVMSAMSNPYDCIALYKNDVKISQVKIGHGLLNLMEFKKINNTLYAVVYSTNIYDRFFFISWDLATSESRLYEYVTPKRSTSNRYQTITADNQGNIYSAGLEGDVFGSDVPCVLKITPDGEISKQILQDAYTSYSISMDTDGDGNVWMVAMDKDYKKLLIYKNGSVVDTIDDIADSSMHLRCKGKDVYLVTRLNGKRITVYKNQEQLFKMDYSGPGPSVSPYDMVISDSGDVYICGQWYKDGSSSVVWKNGREYILIDNGTSFDSIAIVE